VGVNVKVKVKVEGEGEQHMHMHMQTGQPHTTSNFEFALRDSLHPNPVFGSVASNTFQDKDRRRSDCCAFNGLVVVVVVEQVFDGFG
jgi:hypothetical protein